MRKFCFNLLTLNVQDLAVYYFKTRHQECDGRLGSLLENTNEISLESCSFNYRKHANEGEFLDFCK